ncbi:MAG: 30S ribosomal protein S18 [Dehalococcoidia bacterium]
MTTHGQTTNKPFRGKSRFFQKRKVCHFCMNKISNIDYKDTNTLRRYISDQNRIESSRKTGVCPKHQRGLSSAIKRARILSLVPSDGSHGSGRLSSRNYQSQDRTSENSYSDRKSDSKNKEENTTEENTAKTDSDTKAENTTEENTAKTDSDTKAENTTEENTAKTDSDTKAENTTEESATKTDSDTKAENTTEEN